MGQPPRDHACVTTTRSGGGCCRQDRCWAGAASRPALPQKSLGPVHGHRTLAPDDQQHRTSTPDRQWPERAGSAVIIQTAAPAAGSPEGRRTTARPLLVWETTFRGCHRRRTHRGATRKRGDDHLHPPPGTAACPACTGPPRTPHPPVPIHGTGRLPANRIHAPLRAQRHHPRRSGDHHQHIVTRWVTATCGAATGEHGPI